VEDPGHLHGLLLAARCERAGGRATREANAIHSHDPHDTPADPRRKQRALGIALGANATFLAVELVGGIAFGSLALLADAAHMTSDVLALSVAFLALRLGQRPPSERHTFGLARAEVLGAQFNGLLLLAGAGAVIWEAVRRIGDPPSLDAGAVLVIGIVGLLVNLASAIVVGRVAHHDLNLRAALWHLGADALGSVAVVVAALSSLWLDVDGVDPVASLAIAALVIVAAARLLRDSGRVLLEAVPAGVDLAAVRAALASAEGVDAVHHLHVWTSGAARVALSAHVVLAGPLSLHEAQQRVGNLKAMLDERFAISHATIEVECHDCADEHLF
jgi:cobalt-zinc-cadmium efflux system protein